MVLPLLIAASAALAGGGSELAFVAAEGDDMLVAVDIDGRRVAARIAVPNGPHNVAVSHDRRWVLVTSPPAGRVTLVDASTGGVKKTFGPFGYPHDVEVSPDGRFAYITDESRGRVVVLALRRRHVAHSVDVGGRPHDLAVSPDGRSVWVTRGRSLGIAVLDTSRPARARVVGNAGARGSHDIVFAADGVHVWVTYWDSGVVGKIRAYRRTGRLRSQARLGSLVHHVDRAAQKSRVWITDHHDGTAKLLDARTSRPLRTLRGCPGAHHVAFAPGTGRVVVACHDNDSILVFDPRTDRARTLRVGGGPHGVAVAVVP